MKNRGVIIGAIIAILVLVIVLTGFLIFYLSGGANFKNGFIFRTGSKNNNVVYEKTFEDDNIKNIEIKHDAGDVVIKESSDNSIRVIIYGDREEDVKVDYSEEKLGINYSSSRKFTFFGIGAVENDIVVYVPSNYSNNIKVNNNYGKCELANFKNASIDIDCDAGNVDVGIVKDAVVKCDYGNVKIKEILNKCNIKADCGNIEIDKISIKESSNIGADLGNVIIREVNDIYIDANVDLGNANINKNNRNSDITLKIKCDCGNIDVE